MSVDVLERLPPRCYADVARMILPTPVYEWILSGALGSPDPGPNEAAFRRFQLVPRVLVDVSAMETSATLLGSRVEVPIMAAPMGVLGAVYPNGEGELARGMALAGAGAVIAANSTTAVEEVAAAAPGAPLWMQLYNWRDRGATERLIDRAVAAGCTALVPVVNTPVPAAHVAPQVGFTLPAGLRFAHFDTSPDLDPGHDVSYLRWLSEIAPIPVVAKGVMHPDDALRALESGCAGVIVSNHGNRQLPRSAATLAVLPAVSRAVGDAGEVYLDGGIRHGVDVLIALALGARAVFIGRQAAYALAVGGAEGVRRMMVSLQTELVEAAALCGVPDVSQVPADLVVRYDDKDGS